MITLKHFKELYEAGEAGDLPALYQMGNILMNGDEFENGVEIDKSPSLAFMSYQQAQDYAPAKVALAKCYLEGIGTDIDEKKAFSLLRKAFCEGIEEAKDLLVRFRQKLPL